MKPELRPAVMAAITRQQSLLYLTLILGHEVFAWDGLEIKDLVDHRAMTQMSGMPSFICGGVSWCGDAVPVVDLEARISRKTTPITKHTRILIVEMAQGGIRQLLGIVMNPRAPALGEARSAADIRRTLGIAPDAAPAAESDHIPTLRCPAVGAPRRLRASPQHCAAD